jgi:hypothetical protein
MADDERIEAPITAVTVFRDGARVVRRGTIKEAHEPSLRLRDTGGRGVLCILR